MTKCGKSVKNSTTELGDLRELIQQLIYTLGSLAGVFAHLNGLDQTLGELKEQMFNPSKRNEEDVLGPCGSKFRSNGKDSSER